MFQDASCLSTTVGCFCENFSQRIDQPVNSLTSLVLVAVGLYILLRFIKTNNKILSIMFAISLLVTGFGSAYYHARFDMLGQSLDFLGIFMILMAGPITLIKNRTIRFKFLVFVLSCIFVGIFLIILPEIRRYVFLVSLITLLIFERSRFTKYLRYGLLYFAIGLVVWVIDNYLIYCNQFILLNLHAWWHVFTAIASYYLFIHYKYLIEKKV